MIKCVAIDDEPIALQIIEEFCRRHGDIQITSFTDPIEGLTYVKNVMPQIVFLDIQMNDISGLNIATQLPKEIGIIFTTAYIDYAIEGFNLDAVDYLNKPFSYQRFSQAIQRAIRRIQYTNHIAENKQIIVKQDYSNVPIRLSDILYIEAMENYCKIYIVGKKMVLAHNSMKNILEQLPDSDLLRVHKSYIIPRKQIKSFNRQVVTLHDNTSIPVGRQFAKFLFSE